MSRNKKPQRHVHVFEYMQIHAAPAFPDKHSPKRLLSMYWISKHGALGRHCTTWYHFPMMLFPRISPKTSFYCCSGSSCGGVDKTQPEPNDMSPADVIAVGGCSIAVVYQGRMISPGIECNKSHCKQVLVSKHFSQALSGHGSRYCCASPPS